MHGMGLGVLQIKMKYGMRGQVKSKTGFRSRGDVSPCLG